MSALLVLAYVISFTWEMAYGVALVLHVAVLVGYRDDRLDRACAAAARVHQELWLFAPVGVLFVTTEALDSPHPWTAVAGVGSLAIWWRARDWPDENIWKRRGRKLRDAVKARAGRLVVVPAAAPS